MANMTARGSSKLKKHLIAMSEQRKEAALRPEDIDATENLPLGREALDVAMAWAVIGIFAIAFLR